MLAFDMRVIACDPFLPDEEFAKNGVECDRDLLVEAARNCADAFLGKKMGTLCNTELLK